MRYLKKVEAAEGSVDFFIRTIRMVFGNKRYATDIEQALKKAVEAGIDLSSLDYLARDIKDAEIQHQTNKRNPWRGGF